MATYISWCLVAPPASPHPSTIDGWRRKGLGLFLIIAMIKFGYASSFGVQDVEVDLYLQCLEPEAFQFYTSLGFHQINDRGTDNTSGYALLPKSVREHFATVH